MPIYEYQGQQYDIETTDHAEAKNKILAYLGTSSTPEPVEDKTSKLENMKLQAQSGLAKTANMLAGGTVGAASLGVDAGISALTGEEYNSPVTDWLSKNIIQPNLDVQKQAETSAKQHTDGLGIASSVVGGLGGMVPDILMGGPLQQVKTALPKIGAGVLEASLPAIQKGFAGGLPLSTKHGLERYLESDEKGNSTLDSINAGVGGFANMAAQTTAPMGLAGNLSKRIGTGVAANVPLGIGGRQLENMTSPDNMQQDVYDPVAMITDAVTGGLMHGALGARADLPVVTPKGDPVLGKTQTFDMSLAERKTQLETAIQHGNDALTRMSAKAKLSDAEVARVEKIATDLAENQRQLDALNDVVPKPDVDGIKAEELPSEEITLKPLEEIPDNAFPTKSKSLLDIANEVSQTHKLLAENPEAAAEWNKTTLEQAGEKFPAFIKAVENGSHKEALSAIAEGAERSALRILAAALKAKDFLFKDKLLVSDNMKARGQFNSKTRNVTLNSFLLNPVTYMHEMVHSVTSGMMLRFKDGEKFDGVTTKALEGINKLYDVIKTQHYDKLVETVGELQAKSIMKNEREFVAYGTTAPMMQDFLNGIRLGKNTTGWSKLLDDMAGVFGFNKKETTALKELYGFTDTLIQKSDGAPYSRKVVDDFDIDPTKLDKAISNFGSKINGKLFTAQLRSIYGQYPIVQKVDKILQTAERRMDSLVSDIFGGTSKSEDYKKTNKFFFTLKKIQSGDGLIPAVLKNDYPAIHGVIKALQEGHDLGRSYGETLKANKFNENQTVLFNALVRMQQKLLAAENALRSSAGLNPIPARDGWFPAIRRGDHAVVISRNGVPDHLETFLSKTEADAFIKKHNKSLDDKTTMSYMKREAQDNTENVMKLFDDIQSALEDGRSLDSLRGEYSTDQAGVTTHAMRRTGMPGFIGSEIGLTPAQSGKRFADNIESYVREYAESIRKREVMLGTDKALAEHKDSPNASKVAETMRDYSIGKTAEPQWLKDAGTWWKEKVDSYIIKHPFHDGKLDVHAWDRMSGFLSHIFYASTLTMRPSIWIAQTLTYFNSLRGIGREDISPLQAMAAVGESWTALARGKYVSKDLTDGIKYVSQNLNTFHPQLTNQLNRLSFGRDPESTANQILHVLTGEKMSAGGDTVSRFMTWMTYYHVYQKMGYKGKDLWNKAAEASDENMFVYSKSHQPALYRDLGIIGDQMSPLKTFAHGQLGLLVSDMRNFINQPGAKTAVPLALTAMMSVVFGGAISAPIVAEYELLRKLAVAIGIISEDDFPSVTKTLLEKPEWLSHGLVSSSTGMDIGASMRYNSLVGNLVNSQNAWAALFPASGFVGTVGANTLEMANKKIKGELTEGDKYSHMKKIVPKGPAWAAVDETIFKSHERPFIPMGKRGEALSPQTDEAIWAARMGSRSLEEAKDSTKNLLNREEEKKRNETKARAVDLILDGKIEKGRDLLIKAQVDPHTIKNMLTAQLDRRNRPVLERFYTNKQGAVSSYEQKRKLLEMAGYIEAKND